MNYISLGSNCSVTYQLKKYNLRYCAYPFDNCNINLNKLINVLQNNFNNYTDLKLKKISNKHSTDLSEKSLILTNKYNIKFAHEITMIQELNNFKSSLERRIERFRTITDHIVFIYIELSNINSTFENKINILLNELNKYFNTFILKLIINSNIDFNFPHNVKIYNYTHFSEDWKMDHLDWKFILLN
jgi:hypothetical protein